MAICQSCLDVRVSFESQKVDPSFHCVSLFALILSAMQYSAATDLYALYTNLKITLIPVPCCLLFLDWLWSLTLCSSGGMLKKYCKVDIAE